MLTHAQNEMLTQTGPATPMGALFRRFWIPVLLSKELPEPDGPPIRVKILGEELLAFRDTSGQVGLIEPRCPHRGANLFFGRNEEGGIRCVYHGWKFAADGACLEIPTTEKDNPGYAALCQRARITAYPTAEWGECVWAYLGPPDAMPPLPEMEFALVGADHRFVSKKLQECNWAQSVEGAIDTAHFSFLHTRVGNQGASDPPTSYDQQNAWMRADPSPRYTVQPHDAGLILAGARRAERGQTYWRIAQYLMPNHSYAPVGAPGQTSHGQTWVPIDDTSCWVFTYSWNAARPLAGPEREAYARGGAIHAEIGPDYVPVRRRANDYMIDRQAQKTDSFTGITGIAEQDAAIQDSQGLIHDRTREMLGPTDLGVSQFRVMMLAAAQALAAGAAPPAAARSAAYRVRSGMIVTPDEVPFAEVMLRRFGHADGRFDLAVEVSQ